jgi:hypothetical protein
LALSAFDIILSKEKGDNFMTIDPRSSALALQIVSENMQASNNPGTTVEVYSSLIQVPEGEYSGEMQKNVPHGKGILTYTDSSVYDGFFEDGYMHGYGVFTRTDGVEYRGLFFRGKREGQGTYQYTDGRKYEGEWKDDKKHGVGTFTYATGAKYVGNWVNDKKEGNGTYFFANGDRYVGEFENGLEHGNGIKYYKKTIMVGAFGAWGAHKTQQNTKNGVWKEGKFWNGEIRDDTGCLLFTTTNGQESGNCCIS